MVESTRSNKSLLQSLLGQRCMIGVWSSVILIWPGNLDCHLQKNNQSLENFTPLVTFSDSSLHRGDWKLYWWSNILNHILTWCSWLKKFLSMEASEMLPWCRQLTVQPSLFYTWHLSSNLYWFIFNDEQFSSQSLKGYSSMPLFSGALLCKLTYILPRTCELS